MLEALAAWLALAAVSGQALAAIQKTGAKNDLLSMVVSRGDGVSDSVDTGMIAPPLVSHSAGLSSDPSTEVSWDTFLFSVMNPAAVPDGVAMRYPDEKVSANGRIRTNKDVALLTSAATDRSGTPTRLTTGVDAPARSPFRVINAPQANATLGFSLAGADDFTLGRKNGYGTELKRRAVFNQHDVVDASQGEVVAANGGSGQIKAIQTVHDKDSEAAKVTLIANGKLAPVATVPVPEPGGWAMVLAGLLGVIAIARRRMSL
jgi:hypothetical protein